MAYEGDEIPHYVEARKPHPNHDHKQNARNAAKRAVNPGQEITGGGVHKDKLSPGNSAPNVPPMNPLGIGH